MVASEAKMQRLEDRVTVLERNEAVSEERNRQIVKRLDKIDGHLSRVLWLVVALIIGGFINFMIRGGLDVPI